jgi:hypothetical protein
MMMQSPELMESRKKCTTRSWMWYHLSQTRLIDHGSSSSDDEMDYSVLYAKV